MNKKLIMLSVELVVIGMLLGASVVQALTPTVSLTISSGIYPGAPAYTIWKENLNYYAKNEYGEREFESSNASSVLNSVFSANDGLFLLKNGNYTIDTSLILDSNDVLSGESWTTYLYALDGLDDHLIYSSGSSNVIIQNLRIDGNKDGQTSDPDDTAGIKLYNCNDCLVDNIIVYDTKGRGVCLSLSRNCHIQYSKAVRCGTDYQQGFTIEFCHNCSMNNLYALDCLDESFILAMSNYSSINHCVAEATGLYGTAPCGSVEIYGNETWFSHHCSVYDLKLLNVRGSFGINKINDVSVVGLVNIRPKIHDLTATLDMGGEGVIIYSSYTNNVTLDDIVIDNPERCGIYLKLSPKDIIMSNIRIYGGSWQGDYYSGIFVSDASTNIQIHNVLIENFQGYMGICIRNATYFIVDGVITKNSRTAGVYLGYPSDSSPASHGIISNIIGIDEQVTVWETASCSYNIISNVNGYDSSYVGIKCLGSNSHVVNSWNHTTWIASYP